MQTPRLHWTRGRVSETGTQEWVGCNDAGEPIARVVRILGSAAPDPAVVRLRPVPPRGADWLICIGGQVVGRAALALQAVRGAEAALGR